MASITTLQVVPGTKQNVEGRNSFRYVWSRQRL